MLIRLFIVYMLAGCSSTGIKNESVYVPYIKNSPNECYFLDEFMPVPDGLVSGKHGALALRYYTYRSANYKEWDDKHIILSFYSNNDQCWSLFEEYRVD